MTNVAVTDADREAAAKVFDDYDPFTDSMARRVAQAIARARADADEAGYSRGLREGAASERELCIADVRNRCVRQVGESRLIPGYNLCVDDTERAIAAIRARSEGGKA